MSRFNSLRYHPEPEEMPKPLRKIAVLGKSEFTAGLENCWNVYEARLRESKEITDGLRYLHGTQNMIHCNICPPSVFVNSCSQWKLGGFGFAESSSDSAVIKANFIGYNPKDGHNLQPDLDYIAPEVQLQHTMSPLADIFSLGMVICAIFNDGASLINSNGNVTNYSMGIQKLPVKFQEIEDRLPRPLIEPVRKMISQDIRERPTSQLLALLKVFNEPSLLSYEGLLTLQYHSQNQIKEFFYRFAKTIPEFEETFRYKKVLPLLWEWYDNHTELQSFVLPSILTTTDIAEKVDFDLHIHDRLVAALRSQKSSQTTMVALDLVEFFIKYLTKKEIQEIVLPDISSCIRIGSRESLNTVRDAINVLHSYLGPEDLENYVFPRIKEAIEENGSSGMVQIVMLECIESLISYCRPIFVSNDILTLLTSMTTANNEVVLNVADSNAFSIGNQQNSSPWSSSLQFLNRLRVSSQCSKNMPRRRSSPLGDLQNLQPQDMARSNPSFGQRLSLSQLGKVSRGASWNNSATTLASFERRQSAGGTASNLTNGRYSYLNVGGQAGAEGGFLDPRRHSYGGTLETSLLTAGICEGPFHSSPFGLGLNSRRQSAPLFARADESSSCRNNTWFMFYYF
ncbi:hypothetical protein Aperf_G00000078825 [Anoplocephala perfoliata]